LVDDSGKACLADFGLSTYNDPNFMPQATAAVTKQIRARYDTALRAVGMPESMTTTISSAAASSTLSSLSGAGTFRWMSPERLRPEFYGRKSAKPTSQSDIFSFGMLIYQVRDIQGRLVIIQGLSLNRCIVDSSRSTQ
jgi:serine/threonine protein kinase